mmetsp:Transcript_29659/g.114214  ORF Transcript_29659/g.114214 Transcript_29659/m.114214 type:complete len:84 (+) Transcript_29659:600-851(+)
MQKRISKNQFRASLGVQVPRSSEQGYSGGNCDDKERLNILKKTSPRSEIRQSTSSTYTENRSVLHAILPGAQSDPGNTMVIHA